MGTVVTGCVKKAWLQVIYEGRTARKWCLLGGSSKEPSLSELISSTIPPQGPGTGDHPSTTAQKQIRGIWAGELGIQEK